MELNINSPAYFKEQYGIDDEVYAFCQKAYLFFKDKEYSDTLHTIGIVPVIAPPEHCHGAWKDSIRFLCKKEVAHIVITMDFENYYHADSTQKVEQIKQMILTAIKRIQTKGKFNYEQFKEDFMSIT